MRAPGADEAARGRVVGERVGVGVEVEVDLETYDDPDGLYPLSEQDRVRYISTIR
jgi:hypothetical protein